MLQIANLAASPHHVGSADELPGEDKSDSVMLPPLVLTTQFLAARPVFVLLQSATNYQGQRLKLAKQFKQL